MRIVHTSDWHLGHSLHEVSRECEHDCFLRWLLQLIGREQADALVVAGDLFETANPPAAAEAALFDFVAEARLLFPALQMILVGGNHDSAARLDAPRSILRALGVHVTGELPRVSRSHIDMDRVLVPLKDRRGAVAAWCAAVPFLRPPDLPAVREPEMDPFVEGVRRVYAEVLEEARIRRQSGQAILATGHCYMVDTRLSELSERKILGGNQHALPVGQFPADLAYVALGHLHLAQTVGGREGVRYSGSPMPLSLAEAASAVALADEALRQARVSLQEREARQRHLAELVESRGRLLGVGPRARSRQRWLVPWLPPVARSTKHVRHTRAPSVPSRQARLSSGVRRRHSRSGRARGC